MTKLRGTNEDIEQSLKDENDKLRSLMKELEDIKEQKDETIETLENTVSKLEEERDNLLVSRPVDYDNTSKIARLEIDLEGKQRMCKIQESRCNQLQSLYNLFHCKIYFQ